MKTLQKDLTTGNPGKIIFNFTLPIFIGNVFQQFYSMADTIIVGKFVGTKALAAVGSTGTIMFLINGFILGMTAGFTVLTAQKFGAGDMKAMRKTVGNAAILAIIMSLIMTVLGMMAMKPLLGIMKTPDDIFKDAYAYIMVICGGIAAQMLYNFLSSVLRALGNSKVPLYFLILAALLNIVLDMVSDSNVEAFQYGVKDLVSKQITPDRDESDDSFRVTLADIQGEGMDEIQIRHQGSEELAGYQVDSYQLTAPINYPASAAVSEDILPMFFGLKAQEVAVLHPTAEDRAQVGLDQPYRQVEIEYQTKNSEKNKLSILVSNIDGAGNLYVENGSDVIYKCRPQDISWLNLTVDTVISHTILIPDVTSLKTLTITQGDGSSYQIQFQNMGTDNGKVLYDGKELDVDSFRNFYYGLISVEADEVILENLPDTSGMNKIAEIKFAYMDESKKSDMVTYYSESARKAYAVLDGNERGFRLSETQIDTVLGNLQKLINGEEIKARY